MATPEKIPACPVLAENARLNLETEEVAAQTSSHLRVIFAVATLSPSSGLSRNVLRIARRCQQLGAQVVVLVARVRGDRPTGLAMEVLPVRSWTNHGFNAKFAHCVQVWQKQKGFDCVVSSTPMQGLDVYYAGNPCFVAGTQHKNGWYTHTPRFRQYHEQESTVFKKGASTDILLIAHDQQKWFEQYYGTEAHRFHCLPPGMDSSRLTPCFDDPKLRIKTRKVLNFGEGVFVILMMGSSFHTKGVDRGIHAIASLDRPQRKRTKMVVVGAGDVNRYQRLAWRLGVRNQIHFAGPQQQVAAYYAAADLLLHPARRENTGGVLIEALFCGLPVLASEACGYAHHIDKARAGLICPLPFQQSQLNQRLVEMMSHSALKSWRQNAIAYTKSQDLCSLVDRSADIIMMRAQLNRKAGL
ncbi:MAG: glycosyltransferase family 4 protein [Gammaproteobacteria bacterium]|nr:glycosyltransferase family 4 protein [Gammaproteobacteria bacterium]